MKATIEQPVERMVTLVMTEDEAKTLYSIAPNITYDAISRVGGGHIIATKGCAVFTKIRNALKEIL